MTGALRAKWGKKIEFIFTCVAYSVGLGNVWRFPYLAFKNGGGAFLIPYWLTQIFVGMPLYFMEMSFGQFASSGPITIWKATMLFKGVGISMVIVCATIILYYTVIVAYCLMYFFSSMQSPLPWTHCNHHWSSPHCREGLSDIGDFNMSTLNHTQWSDNNTTLQNSSETTATYISPTTDYFENFVLGMTGGLEDMGSFNWRVALCLLLVWIVVFLVLIKGIRSLGKVVYFTATFPYVLIISLLIRSAMLPGATEGMLYFLTPRWHRLTDATVWSDAATQVFYSLGLCLGGLNIMASFNKFKNNAFSDSLLVPCVDCFTSFLCGLVVFSVLGFMAHTKGVSIEEVAVGGPGLAFIAYPEALSSMPAPTVWAVLFFFMMSIIGFSSQFSMTETVMSSIMDEFSSVIRVSFKRTVLFRFCICAGFYVLALPMTTGGGIYLLNLLDCSVGGYPLLLVGCFEIIAIMYVYGFKRFSEDIAMMLGKKPSSFFKFTWCFFAPVILVGVLVFKAVMYSPLSYDGYTYPVWAQAIGWMVVIFCVAFIPGWMVYFYCRNGGGKLLCDLSKPESDWGPILAENRTGRYAGTFPPKEKIQSGETIPSIVITKPEDTELGIVNTAFIQGDAASVQEGETVEVLDLKCDSDPNNEGNFVDVELHDGYVKGAEDTGGFKSPSHRGSFRSRLGSCKESTNLVERGKGEVDTTDGSCKGGIIGSIRSKIGSIRSKTGSIRSKSGSIKLRKDGSVRSTKGSLRSQNGAAMGLEGVVGYGDTSGIKTNGSLMSMFNREDNDTSGSVKGDFMDTGSFRGSVKGVLKSPRGSIRSFKGMNNETPEMGGGYGINICGGNDYQPEGSGEIKAYSGMSNVGGIKVMPDGSIWKNAGGVKSLPNGSIGRNAGDTKSYTGSIGKFAGGIDNLASHNEIGGYSSIARNADSVYKSRPLGSMSRKTGGSINGWRTEDGAVTKAEDFERKATNEGSLRSMKSINIIDVSSFQPPQENPTIKSAVYDLDDPVEDEGRYRNADWKKVPSRADDTPKVKVVSGLVADNSEEYYGNASKMKISGGEVFTLDEPVSRNASIRSNSGKVNPRSMGVRVFPVDELSSAPPIPVRRRESSNSIRRHDGLSGLATPTGSVRSLRN